MNATIGKLFIVGVLPLTLMACGDGTVGGSAGQPLDFDSAQAYFDAGDEIFLEFEDDFNNQNFDDPGQLQASGTSSYFGPLFLENAALEGAIGGMRLDADFSSNSVTGVVTNIVDYDDLPLDGQINITNGFIDRGADTNVEYTFAADISGTLTNTSSQAAQIEGDLLGDFYSGQDFIAGAVSAEITVEGDTEFLIGGFAAAR